VPFQAVAAQRLYEQVAGQVTELVARGEFKAGDRLPPERDLAKMLAVSRPTVREAMIALEIAGLVEVRGGAGTFVTDKARMVNGTGTAGADIAVHRLFENVGSSPLELLATRRILEPQVAALAAEHGTADEVAAVAETVQMIAAATDTPQHRAADHKFHVRIGLASHNSVLTTIVDECWAEMYSPMFERMGAITGLIVSRCSPQQRDTTVAEHEAVYRAIAARDPAAARAAMDAHLAGVEAILIGGKAAETELTRRERRPGATA
jgi:DNA-binding FadR family transcriptional regulator